MKQIPALNVEMLRSSGSSKHGHEPVLDSSHETVGRKDSSQEPVRDSSHETVGRKDSL